MDDALPLLKKLLHGQDGITERKLYSCPCYYYKEKPLILLTPENQFAVSFPKGLEANYQAAYLPWIWNGQQMKDWYLIPKSHCTKKNRVWPLIEMSLDQMTSRPKKAAKKNHPSPKKIAQKNKVITVNEEPRTEVNHLSWWSKIKRKFQSEN